MAQTHHVDLALPRVKQCLEEADADKLRTLSTNSLYRLQLIRKGLGLQFKDPKAAAAAVDLLPADLRGRVAE
jgi:hypothetical protein